MKRFLDYKTYDFYVKILTNKLKNDNIKEKVDYIYGIPRGGLPIAVHLSHKLDIPITISPIELIIDRVVLLIDDLVDIGNTLSDHLDTLDGEAVTATLFYKPQSIIKPDYYVQETKEWIVFPWENEKPNREGYE